MHVNMANTEPLEPSETHCDIVELTWSLDHYCLADYDHQPLSAI